MVSKYEQFYVYSKTRSQVYYSWSRSPADEIDISFTGQIRIDAEFDVKRMI